MAAFCKDFNLKTQHYKDEIPLRVRLKAKPDGSFTYNFGVPSNSWFILQATKQEKGLKYPGMQERKIKIHIKHCYEIAKIKHKELPDASLQSVTKMVIGSVRSLGFDVDWDKEEQKIRKELNKRNKAIKQEKADRRAALKKAQKALKAGRKKESLAILAALKETAAKKGGPAQPLPTKSPEATKKASTPTQPAKKDAPKTVKKAEPKEEKKSAGKK